MDFFRSTGSGKIKFVTTGTIVTVVVGKVVPKSQDQPIVEEMIFLKPIKSLFFKFLLFVVIMMLLAKISSLNV